jgi:predicted LPLAT superfamily acyltransferase
MSSWEGKSKGSVLGYRIFVWSLKTFGVRSAYALLHPVTYFYYLFSAKAANELKRFYEKVLPDKKPHNRLIRRTFLVFGRTLVDRVALGLGMHGNYTFRSTGREFMRESFEKGQGCLLISAHLGNWEIAGNLLEQLEMPINVVMLDAENEQLKLYLASQNRKATFKVIPIKNDMSHLLGIRIALQNGEIVCIHGDRFVPGARTMEADFFGQAAHFPQGPFQVAAKFKVPYHIVFALKDGVYGYKFSSTPGKITDNPHEVLNDFVNELENRVSEHPEQWFNFYNFYAKPEK